MTGLSPAPSVTLLRGGGDELDDVMRVMGAAFEPSFGEAWTRAQCAGILPMHGVLLTLARAGPDPVGFSLVRSVADESELLLLAVSPPSRGRGIGGLLLHRFMADAGAAGARRLHLEVRDGNPAVALYHRHAFRIEGRRPGYYRGRDGQKHDALTMARGI